MKTAKIRKYGYDYKTESIICTIYQKAVIDGDVVWSDAAHTKAIGDAAMINKLPERMDGVSTVILTNGNKLSEKEIAHWFYTQFCEQEAKMNKKIKTLRRRIKNLKEQANLLAYCC